MLTDAKLRTLRGRESLYRVADAQGLAVEVPPAGALRWRFRYRFAGKAKMLGLGTYPDVKLSEARDLRDDARRMLRQGIDPSAERQEQQKPPEPPPAPLTFEQAARDWMQRQDVAPVTANKNRWLFEKFLFPTIGTLPLAEITPRVLLAALKKIEGDEQNSMRETARRAKIKTGQVFRFAIIEGLAEIDPTASLRGALPKVKEKHHAAVTDPAKIGDLLRAVYEYTGQPVTVCAMKLSAMCFVRPGELRLAKWEEFDLDGAMWRIPAERMKMKAAHLVPLSAQAVAVLRDLHEHTGSGEYAFPAVYTQHRPMSENTVNLALRRLGYTGQEMTAHGFRSMAATRLNEMGWRADAIERQLAHAESNKVRGAYTHAAQYLDERKRMMQAWADYLDGLRAGANVVPIRRAS